MKRKEIITLFCFLLSLVVGLCIVGCAPESSGVRLVLGEGKNITVDETSKTITTEARESASIPMAAVVDEEGNIQEDYVVTRTITDGEGNKKPSTLTMQHGEVYKVDYSATDGDKTLELSYTIKCFDTIVPTLTFIGLNRTYQIGQTVSIVPSGLPADLDYDNSSIKLINKDTNGETVVPFDGGYSFEAGVAGSFKVVATLKDNVGNSNEITAGFNIVGAFEDTDVDPNCIWDFNEAGYLSNVILASTSAVPEMDVVTDGEVKALKISLKAGEEYDMTFTKGKSVEIIDTSAINFTVKAQNVIDTFEVYNVDDGTYYDLSWRFGGYADYKTIGFDPYGLYTEDYILTAIKVKLMAEEDTDVFIDSIGYDDAVEKWIDEDLQPGAIAVFDDAGYMERVGAATSKDYTTFNSSAVLVTSSDVDAEIAAGFTGGSALKFTSNTDPSTTSDKQARDGFSFTFFERMSASDFNMLAFKIYCEEPFVTMTVNFTDTKRGESNFIWVTLNPSAYVGQWATVVVPADSISEILTGCENVVSMTVRFLRREQTTSGAVLYLDRILNQSVTFDDFDYDFSEVDDLDYYAVSSAGSATVAGIVADNNATCGYALKGVTALNMQATSGLEIAFNDIEIADYLDIIIRVRTSDQVGFSANGTYVGGWGEYANYTEISVKALLEARDMDTLSTLLIGRQSVGDIEMYVDYVKFIPVPDYEEVDYDFGSADDPDLTAALSHNGGTVVGIVADSDATGGYALKGITGLHNDVSGIQIFFNDIDVNDYLDIVIRLRTTNGVQIEANGVGLTYGTYSTYTDVSLLAKMKEHEIDMLSTLSIGRAMLNNIEIYVDSIKFVEIPDYSELDYDFGSLDDTDIVAVAAYNGGTVNGIVADSAAADGFALKATTVFDNNVGVQIRFGELNISDYAAIRLIFRTAGADSGRVSLSLNGGSDWGYGAYASYTTVDLLAKFIEKNTGETVLSSLEIFRSSVAGIEIYIDSITLVKKSEINYDFSSETDKDMYLVSSYAGGTVNGIVADGDATGGFALKATTVPGGANGVSISFGNLDLTEYRSIIVRVKTVGGAVSFYINGDSSSGFAYGEYASYTDLYITDYITATTISSVQIARNVANIQIFVDSIKIIKVDYSTVNYDFSSATDNDLDTVSTVAKGKVLGIVADTDATDGYALKGMASTYGGSTQSGIKITFDNLDLTKYSAINVRIKTVHASGNQVQFMANGVGAGLNWAGYGSYTVVDVLALIKASKNESYQDITTLKSIEITRDNAANIEVYIDYIEFVPAE